MKKLWDDEEHTLEKVSEANKKIEKEKDQKWKEINNEIKALKDEK